MAIIIVYYRIAGKLGELSAIRQTKLVLTINNLLIRQTFFRQMLKTSQLAKLSRYTATASRHRLHQFLEGRIKIDYLVKSHVHWKFFVEVSF